MSSDLGNMRRRSSAASNDTQTGSSGAPGRWSTSQMESSVTRLLVATKQLLEALTRWSLRNRCTEGDVSDIYVRLGNDFNSAKLAFQSYGISMDDLASVPGDLRTCLEECLSEEASPQVLEIHLPRIREIIIGLLQGLKLKQAEYKQLLLVQRANSTASTTSVSAGQASSGSGAGGAGGNVAGPRQLRGSHHQQSDSSASIPYPGSSAGGAAAAAAAANNQSQLSPASAHPAKQPSLRALRSRDALERRASKRFSTYTFSKITGVGHHQIGGHGPTSSGLAQLAHLGMGPGVSAGAAAAAAGLHAGDTGPSSSASSINGVPTGSASSTPSNTPGVGSIPGPISAPPPPPTIIRRDSSQNTPTSTRRNAVLNPANASHRRTDSLARDAVPPRAEGNTPPVAEAEEEQEFVSAPGQSSVLATPTPPCRTSSTTHQHRGSISDTSSQQNPRNPPFDPVTLVDPPRAQIVTSQPVSVAVSEPVPAFIPPTATATAAVTIPSAPVVVAPSPPPVVKPPPRPPLTGDITVFVQQGRLTKRATISLSIPLSIARLRMLFIDKFGYSPGKDDFPPIYVKDQTSGVDYELEESELMQVNSLGVDRAGGVVKDGMLLSLNIEPLDQVKQHLDLTLGNLTREVRELKTAFQEREREARRVSRNYGALLDPNSTISGAAAADASTPAPSPQISDSQFAAAGQRMVQMRRANTSKSSNGTMVPQRSDSAGLASTTDTLNGGGILRTISPQPTGSSISSHAAGIAALELKTQHDEISRLRREFAILAQVQTDFQTDFKGLLGQLRASSSRVREIAKQDVSMERNFIVAGKAKLDTSSQEVLTLVEDLQDTVDDLKLDVIQRGVKPKPAILKKISQDIEKALGGLEDLEKYVHNVKPSWKKTWEVELQNIVDEQEFLNHEEGLLSDLREDVAALQEVFDNIQQVVKLRVASARAGSAGARGYLPPPPEEGHQGLNTVMLEVRTQAVDHDRRLRAVEAAEEKRQRELASQTNDFAEELAGFVDGKILRRTGGHMEAERVRQKRNDATLRSMITGEGVGGAPQVIQPLGPAVTKEKPTRLVLGDKAGAVPGPGSAGAGTGTGVGTTPTAKGASTSSATSSSSGMGSAVSASSSPVMSPEQEGAGVDVS